MTEKIRARYDYDSGCLHYPDGRIRYVRELMNLQMEKMFGRRWERDIKSGKITNEQIQLALRENKPLKELLEDSNEQELRADAGGESQTGEG